MIRDGVAIFQQLGSCRVNVDFRCKNLAQDGVNDYKYFRFPAIAESWSSAPEMDVIDDVNIANGYPIALISTRGDSLKDTD